MALETLFFLGFVKCERLVERKQLESRLKSLLFRLRSVGIFLDESEEVREVARGILSLTDFRVGIIEQQLDNRAGQRSFASTLDILFNKIFLENEDVFQRLPSLKQEIAEKIKKMKRAS